MHWILARMKWVMLVSGLLTCTMIQMALAPRTAMHSMFGDSLEGPLAEIIVRSWGSLIGLVGLMLVYGAFRPQYRRLILVIAGTGKLTFVALVLLHGRLYLGQQAGIAVAVDSVMVVLFALYLFGARSTEAPRQSTR